MRVGLLLLLLGACARPTDVQVRLHMPKDAPERAAIRELTLRTRGDDGAVVFENKISVDALAFNTPNLDLREPIKFEVEGLDAAGVIIAHGSTIVKQVDGEASAHLYFGPTSRFAVHPSEPRAHRTHASVLATSAGIVWLMGGNDAATGTLLATTEYYDPRTLTFTDGPPLTGARSDATLFPLRIRDREYFLIVGGDGANDTFQLLDVDNASLTPPAVLSLGPRIGAAVAQVDASTLALIGGHRPDGTFLSDVQLITLIDERVYAFPPSTLTLEHPQRNARAFPLGDGRTGIIGSSGAIESIDLASGAQATFVRLSAARDYEKSTYALFGRTLFVLGGGIADISRWTFLARDTTLAGFVPGVAREQMAALALSSELLLVAGGTLVTTNAPTNVSYLLDFTTNPASVALRSFAFPRVRPELVRLITGDILAIGGGAPDAPSVEILTVPYSPSVSER